MDDQEGNEIDTSTTEGFNEALAVLDMHTGRASMVLGTTESTLRAWRHGKRPVHPTAAVMLDWIGDGFRPDNWHMMGSELREAREQLDLSREQLGEILDAEASTIAMWESDDQGPPGFVATAVRWLMDGFRPEGWPID